MPGRDGTGPICAQGRGWRCRRAYGRDFAQRVLTKEDEKRMLEEELKDIKQRLEELK